jgi:NADH-quinone oxidoreductase subunit I
LASPFIEQPIEQEGLLTIQYPEEKRLLPERFRYIPMLIWDTAKNEDLCTACGICAKVCPPQCIWIVRDIDANGSPFDAIKMNHDYELAVYDRYPQLVYDKEELTVPVEYYAALWPSQYEAEEQRRRQEKEAERAREEAKARAAAEKAAAAKRSTEELEALKQQAAAKAAARQPSANDANGEAQAEDADAKKARLEELKRKAAEAARKRKEAEA